jgi:NitT/TauT family transport system ATP-binding protein
LVSDGFLEIQHLGMSFRDNKSHLEVLRDVNFSLGQEEFLCVLGPSGSGKSTLLRLIAGLLKPTEGKINFGGCDCPPRVGLVFQYANLMPWRTVWQNIALPLELQQAPAVEIAKRVDEMIELVGLAEFSHNWPSELSGGMAQRVAIARAFIQEPDLLLLDEPFGALDALTRERMGAELLNIWQGQRIPVVMVTHSISEALLLSDRVLVFTQRPGQITQDVAVTFPRPRTEELRYSTAFQQLERDLRGNLRVTVN